MKIKVQQAGKFTEIQKIRLEQAETLLNSIIGSIDFKLKVAGLDPSKYFSGTFTKPREIAEIFGEATRDAVKVVNVAVWYVPWYKRYTSAIAYESNNRVNLRSTYLEFGEIQSLAATLLHEYMHTIGFSHDFWNTARRKYSVPYAIGQIIQEWKV